MSQIYKKVRYILHIYIYIYMMITYIMRTGTRKEKGIESFIQEEKLYKRFIYNILTIIKIRNFI